MGGKLKQRDLRAIAVFAELRNLIPQLSAWPQMRFKDRDGNIIEVGMVNILAVYDVYKKSLRKSKKE